MKIKNPFPLNEVCCAHVNAFGFKVDFLLNKVNLIK